MQQWRDATGLAELEEAISQTHAAIPPLRERRSKYVKDVDRFMSRRSELLTERRHLREELDVIEEQCGDISYGEEAAGLADHLKSIRRDLINRQADVKFLEEKLEQNEEERSEIRRKIGQLHVYDTKGALIKRQKESVDRVADALEKITRIQKDDVRQDLDEQIGEIWRDEVERGVYDRIGKRYILELHTPKEGADREIKIDGRSYPYVIAEHDPAECAIIREVKEES